MTPETIENIIVAFGYCLIVFVVIAAVCGFVYDVRKLREIRRKRNGQ